MIFNIRATAFKHSHFTDNHIGNPERSLQGVANWSFQRQQWVFGVSVFAVMQQEALMNSLPEFLVEWHFP